MRRHFLQGLLRWAGGGFAPPLAGPVASRRILLGLPSRPQGSPTRSTRAVEGLGWTPSRPPAGAIESERDEPSGRARLDGVLGNGEGATRVPPRVAAVMPPIAIRVYCAGVTEGGKGCVEVGDAEHRPVVEAPRPAEAYRKSGSSPPVPLQIRTERLSRLLTVTLFLSGDIS